MSNPWKLFMSLFSIVFLLACPTRDPFAVNANCPEDAPCFLSVLAPQGQTAAPGPYNMVAEVTGPHRIEGVGLVLSVNGATGLDLRLARLTSGNSLWGVPDLDATSIQPPEAIETARVLSQLQPGDTVNYILFAWDQMGKQTDWFGDGRNDVGSASFQIVDGSGGLQALDAGTLSDGGIPTDGGVTQVDGGVTPPVADGGAVVGADVVAPPSSDAG